MLTILDSKEDEKRKVLCLCECGTEKRITFWHVKSGGISSCGCLKKKNMAIEAKKRFSGKSPANFIDYTGKKIGMITVLRRVSDVRLHATTYEIQCECGSINNVEISTLRRAKYKRCECGYKKDPLKNILQAMIERCTNEKEPSYRWYGARGIKVCEEWMKFPIKFIEWSIKNAWQSSKGLERKKTLTIDRIDSSKDYCPENCQWITLSDNSKKAMKERWHGK